MLNDRANPCAWPWRIAARRARGLRDAALIALLLVHAATARCADLSLQDRRSDFERLVSTIDEDYVYAGAGIPCWPDLRARFAERVDAASTPDRWRRVVEDVLDELHDFHVEVSPGSAQARWHVPTSADTWAAWQGGSDGRAIVTAVRRGSDAARAGVRSGDELVRIDGLPAAAAVDAALSCEAARRDPAARRWALLAALAGRVGAARQWTLRDGSGTTRVIRLPEQRQFDRPAEPVSLTHLPTGEPLLRINNSLGRQRTVAAFDAALARVRDAPGLILDLRDVPSGGNSSVALGILGRFVSQRLPYQRHRIPAYGQPDVERNWVEEVAPRGPFTYGGRLVVLVDAWTGSMGEGMAIGLDGMKRARVIGSAMAGLAGSVEPRRLPATGLELHLPVEQLFHIDGTPRHRWRPPVEIDPDAAEGDAAIARARELLLESPR